MFYDTVKGGDYRAREANVYRSLSKYQTPSSIGTRARRSFRREYGLLDNRSFGGAGWFHVHSYAKAKKMGSVPVVMVQWIAYRSSGKRRHWTVCKLLDLGWYL